jgi:hypothetical protein
MVNANPSRTSLLLPLLGLCLGLLAGCGSPDEGFGVVLWGGNTFSLRPGVIVDIHDEHKLDDTLTVSLKETGFWFVRNHPKRAARCTACGREKR